MTGMDPAIVLTVRLSLALLLAVSAWHKLRDPRRFRAVLAAYEIVPPALVRAVAPALAAAEVGIALALATGALPAIAGVAAATLFLVYAFAIQVNVARGRAGIDCGCMGPAVRVPLSGGLVARNVVLAAGASIVAMPSAARALAWADCAGAVAATVVLSLSWLASERLLALAPRAAMLRSRRRP